MKNKRIPFSELKKLSVKDRAPIAIPRETYFAFKDFHDKHGAGQVWHTAQSVVEAGIEALREKLEAA